MAGEWRQKGITAYNLCQCLTVAVGTILMVFVETEWIMLVICCFYVFCVASLCVHMKRVKSKSENDDRHT